jgi:hypothetical protein
LFCFSGSPFTIDAIDTSSSRLVEEWSTKVYNSEEPVMVNMEKHLNLGGKIFKKNKNGKNIPIFL